MSEQLIFQLIPKVMAEVGAIEKNRQNQAQKYKFRGVDDVYAAFHGPLAKHGLFYVPEVLTREISERPTQAGGVLFYTRLLVAYTFYAPDGSSIRAVVAGEGMDSSDKSTNKAMSAALKYALLQIFCVPVEDQDDADAETPEPVGRPKPAPAKPGIIVEEVTPESERAKLEAGLKELFKRAGKASEWQAWRKERDLDNRPLPWMRATFLKWQEQTAEKEAA